MSNHEKQESSCRRFSHLDGSHLASRTRVVPRPARRSWWRRKGLPSFGRSCQGLASVGRVSSLNGTHGRLKTELFASECIPTEHVKTEHFQTQFATFVFQRFPTFAEPSLCEPSLYERALREPPLQSPLDGRIVSSKHAALASERPLITARNPFDSAGRLATLDRIATWGQLVEPSQPRPGHWDQHTPVPTKPWRHQFGRS